ncbi:HigA family addiction module antitoxin [Pseudodesulfovibrio portus]|uniref:HigA family addiction module antitoxin n=1 Tax=Pseudodesulfovibrio portus TaxID=231439 RepID=UPI002230693F|nr:HigA family addiction module antitoxin [Pseudodesulfovibrio portus]
MANLAPIHPGEILLEEFMAPLGLSRNKLSQALCIPAQRVGQIVMGHRGITVDTAIRLAHFFGTTPEFWLNLQQRYDLESAKEGALIERVEREVRTCEELQLCA